MKTSELLDLLRSKYSGNGYALFTEVADGTGSSQSRWADALVISLWPSRGLTISGFELKVARADWVKELASPEKAEAVCRYCDYWWVVADKDVVRKNELPPTWGLMVANGNGLRTDTAAPKLEPAPLDRCFVAALARRAVEQTAEAAALKAEYERGVERGKDEAGWDTEELKRLREHVAEFSKASGIDLDPKHWGQFRNHDPNKIGAAVLAALGESESIARHFDYMRRTAQEIIDKVDAIQKPTETFKRRRRA